jgi:hypothetical protein
MGSVYSDTTVILLWMQRLRLCLLVSFQLMLIIGFAQCFIIMTMDRGTNSFVPCVYALMTGKSEHLYCVALHEVIMLMEWDWMPDVITVDFEAALLAAVRHEFSRSQMVGCFFHFRQAISRKMKKIGISFESFEFGTRIFNLLTLVDPTKLKKIIQQLQSRYSLDDEKWMTFWTYFEKTWMSKFEPFLWNVFAADTERMYGRTNNALESYNRRIGERFSSGRPSLIAFVQVLREEVIYFDTVTKNIRSGVEPLPMVDRSWKKPEIDAEFKFLIN